VIRNKWYRGLGCGLVAFLFSLLSSSSGPLRVLEWKTWDLRQRTWAQPEKASPEIILVLIDQPSLDFYAQQGISWPWPRQMYAAVLDFLRLAQAKAVVLDLILSEPSAYGVEDDRLLAEAIKRQGKTFLSFGLSQSPPSKQISHPALLSRFSLTLTESQPAGVVETKSALLPLPELLAAAHGAGNILFLPDDDAIFRRLPLYFRFEGLLLPSLPLAVAWEVKGQDFQAPPYDREGKMVLRFSGPTGVYKSYSIASIINSWAQLAENQEPQVQLEEFKHKIVFLGANAPGLLDLRPTPISSVTPGVEIQATAVDNLIQGRAIGFPPRLVSGLFILFFALVTGLGVTWLVKIRWIILWTSLCFIGPGVGAFLAFRGGTWLEVVPAELAVLISFFLAALLNYNVEGRERRFIKNVFRHYLSPEIIERVIANPSLLKLGGETREITSFFSDVAGFSSVAENLSPEALVRWLNVYLSAMTEIILEEGGTLDKYEGDAIIAFWNAPLDQPDHALRGCRAALRCQRELARLNPELEKVGGKPIRIRIGLNSGPAVVGNMGSSRRFDYTAMGDTVNLASRLEGAAKFYGVSILIGEYTYRAAAEYLVVRPVDVVRVVGKRQPVEIYELLGFRDDFPVEKQQELDVFAEAWQAYRQRDWSRAISLLASLEPDNLTKVYLERCREFAITPPPLDWDGVYELRQK